MPDFLRYSNTERRRFRWEKDIHFTPVGHRVLADSLAPVLEKMLFSSAEQKEMAQTGE